MNTSELCFFLTGCTGVSGDEKETGEKVKELLSPYMSVKTDRLYNVIAERKGRGKHFLIDAHLDRIGLVITGINDKGFLKFANCGGIDERTLIGSEVIVFGKKPLFGVICSVPPHLSGKDDKLPGIDEMCIDIGYNSEEAHKLVEAGDRAIVRNNPVKLLGNRISSAALDNRAGVAAAVLCVKYLEKKGFDGNLTVMLSSQEEVGLRGAKVGAYVIQADEAVVVDVTFGTEPSVSKEESGELGKGPLIGFSPVLDRKMSQRLVAVAETENIPYSREVMSSKTGTNADSISESGRGIPTVTVSIPIKNMHTQVEVADTEDIENTAKLIAEYILSERCKDNV